MKALHSLKTLVDKHPLTQRTALGIFKNNCASQAEFKRQMHYLAKQHKTRWADCNNCDLACTRHQVVQGRGDLPCDAMFVGEGPGEGEDTLGQAFIGRAGRLLQEAVDLAQLHFPDPLKVYFTNLVGCRPVNGSGSNRPPKLPEVQACKQRLETLINIGAPRLVIPLGRVPNYFMVRSGLFDDTRYMDGVKIEDKFLWHPAAILRRGGVESSHWPSYCNQIELLFTQVYNEKRK